MTCGIGLHKVLRGKQMLRESLFRSDQRLGDASTPSKFRVSPCTKLRFTALPQVTVMCCNCSLMHAWFLEADPSRNISHIKWDAAPPHLSSRCVQSDTTSPKPQARTPTHDNFEHSLLCLRPTDPARLLSLLSRISSLI